MYVRKLAMYFPDDRPVENTTFLKLYHTPSWESHCRAIFEQKFLEFDLLSSDINFDQDTSDPCTDGYARSANCAGLVHALAGLARRKGVDDFGNQLPLSWEVRSVSPYMYSGENDAIRLYGLLRSLASSPLKGEGIEDCVWREYEEVNGKSPELSREAGGEDLALIFSADLKAQRSHTSNPQIAVDRLLPRWRIMLLDAISRGICIVHHDSAIKEFRRLSDIYESGDSAIGYDADNRLYLPIADGSGRCRYGIDLFSIFADRLDYDPETGSYRLSLMPNVTAGDHLKGKADWCESKRVLDWYASVTEVAGSPIGGSPGRLARICHETLRLYKEDREARRNSEIGRALSDYATSYNDLRRAMIFCCLCAYRVIMHNDRNFGPTHINTVFDIHGTNVHFWARGRLKVWDHFPKNITPGELGSAICSAMLGEGPGILGEHWNWIRDGLRMWLSETNDSQLKARAQRVASGLFQDAP